MYGMDYQFDKSQVASLRHGFRILGIFHPLNSYVRRALPHGLLQKREAG